MLSASNLESIQSEGQRFVEAVRRDPDAPVPQYPGWSLSDLASHTASVHIYVTHDQVEAMTMADRIAVMSAGELQAFDKPDDLYERPKTLFVAGFVGNPPMNFMDVEVTRENGDFRTRSATLDLTVAADRAEAAAAHQGTVILGVRPEDITIATGSAGDGATAAGEALAVEPLGREDLVVVQVGTEELRLLVDNTMGVKIGDNVGLKFDKEKVQFFDPETENSLIWS